MPILVHPAKVLDSNAFLSSSITSYVITPEKLDELKRNVLNFFNSFHGIPFEEISSEIISKALGESYLDKLSLHKVYLDKITHS